MASAAVPPPLVIGLGNEHRHDDRCGLDVIRALRARPALNAQLLEGGDDATTLLDLWEGTDRVFVVDAIRSGTAPGTVHRFEVTPGSPGAGLPVTSTHGLSLGEAIGLARSLGRLPRALVVYGIEAGDVSPGAGLTPGVAASVLRTAERLATELTAAGASAHA